ncbi:TetR/AcrR family transcriptional regulator [Mycolicibacterium sp.]|uniref:TetR/AcrR family transcriptional regulator n=1 Tax=Mycolicibacterium sp. TaxID=2320850 RepID=UPI003D0C460D
MTAGTETDKAKRTAEDGRVRRGMKTREQLLIAAIELFESKGFKATSMKDLAAAAGVQAPAIYNHFKSKDDILAAALEWELENFERAVCAPDDPQEPACARLEKLVRRHVAYQFSKPTIVRSTDNLIGEALRGFTLAPVKVAKVRTIVRTYRGLVTTIVNELRDESSVDLAPTTICVSAILDLCDRTVNWYRPDGDLTPIDFEDGCWNMVKGMLRLDRYT